LACVARYLAEVSRPEKKTMARHMRPMALRRSAARAACSSRVVAPRAGAGAGIAAASRHGALS
jgi:hypothetical protein